LIQLFYLPAVILGKSFVSVLLPHLQD
jgi:hypothetical protein